MKTIDDYKMNAVKNLFSYLDSRKGRLLFLYQSPYSEIANQIEKYLIKTGRNDVDMLIADDMSVSEIYYGLTESDKFLCAANRSFETGLTDIFETMLERAVTLGEKAFTITDCSELFFDIFQAESEIISKISRNIISILQNSKKMIITDSNGTNLEVVFDNKYGFVNMDGISEADYDLTCNLPVGEVATYTPNVNGDIYFTGALLGTIPIGRKYGLIEDPIYIKISNGEVVDLICKNNELKKDIEFCLYYDEFTHMINEVALGTNYAIPKPLEGFNYKHEEHQLGFHIGFGASLAQQDTERLTGHHLDLIFADSVVSIDDQLLFDNNTYHFNNFKVLEKNEPLRISKNKCCVIS